MILAPSAPADQTRRTPALRLLVLLVVVTVALSSAFRGQFFMDDAGSIPGNPTLRHAWPPDAALTPPAGAAVSGRPIVNYSFALNDAIDRAFGLGSVTDRDARPDTLGLHVGNTILHLGCALLLFALIARTLRQPDVPASWRERADDLAFAATALWALHPIQTEAVHYLVQRTELLVSLWYLVTMYASVRAWDSATRSGRHAWYVVAIPACLLGMGSKEVMITAPIMVALYDRAFRLHAWRDAVVSRRIWFYAALGSTSVWLVVLVAGGSRNHTVGFETGLPWYEYAYTQAWAVARYLRLLAWPAGLTFDYGARPVSDLMAVPGGVLLLLLLALTIIAWRRGGVARRFSFLGAWFFVLLAPSSSIIPIATEIAAERRVYLASAAVAVLATSAVFAASLRWAWRLSRPILIASTATVAIALAGLTFVRGRAYDDVELMWRDVIDKRPDNARAYLNLGNVYLTASPPRFVEADSMYRRAVALDSGNASAWFNLAEVAESRGDAGDAEALLRRTLSRDPNHAKAARRLGSMLIARGDAAEALQFLEHATSDAPTEDEVLDLAEAYAAAGRPQDAATVLRRVLSRAPPHVRAMSQYGALLLQYGRAAEGLPYLEEAARQQPTPLHLATLSLANATVGNLSEAIGLAARSAAAPTATAYSLTVCGWSLTRAGRPRDAKRMFERAIALEPGYQPAHRELDRFRDGARPAAVTR